MTLFDVWVFKGPRWADWPVASWVPIDHVPAPLEVAAWCSQKFVAPIAMSKFGASMLNNVGVECFYVPHAIEKVFKPTENVITVNQTKSKLDLLATLTFMHWIQQPDVASYQIPSK
jgi:hypothetical protein